MKTLKDQSKKVRVIINELDDEKIDLNKNKTILLLGT